MTTLRNLFRISCKLMACAVLLCTGFFRLASASSIEPVMTGRTTIVLSASGASEVKIALQTQPNHYTALKQFGSNFNLLARQLGMDHRNWTKQSNVTGAFVDASNELDITYTTPGAVRNVKGNRWVYSVQSEPNCQLVSASGTKVTLMSVESTDIGLGTMVVDVELPAGATNASFDKARNEVTFEFTPSVESGSNPDLEFEVDHKSIIMSSLAKNYSNPNFRYLWAARAIAKNSGDQILSNYRVRFRVAEMGSWSAWQRSAHLYPGQSIIDPFFPIFDLEKIMAMNGSRPAVIEVEMEYETADGKKVEESDSFPVQLLSRNEVIYSSLRPEEITGYADQFDYAPSLMTAMTTPADPVVQQLAGRVNGMAAATFNQTIGAVYSDAECIAFMQSLWHFMQSNHIAYQSPAGNDQNGNLGQHVKYTRDVLRNRAGTCIDLSIMWASVCEAVGLDPAVVLIPGHAFPAVRLPQSGQWLALESTMLNDSFEAAVNAGKQTLEEALNGDHYLVDIKQLRAEGILGLDLPNVSEDYLTNLGYTFVPAQLNVQPTVDPNVIDQTYVPTTDTAFNPNGDQTDVASLVGTWGGWGIDAGRDTWVGLALNSDATFEILYQYTEQDGSTTEDKYTGTWGKRGDKVVLTIPGADPYEYPFEFTGDTLKFCVLGGTQVVTLDRKS